MRLKTNLSATLEQRVRAAQRKKWLAENKEGLKTCNKLAEKHGLFGSKYRVF